MKKGKITISAIVIAKNEEEKISACLKSLKWVDEIIVVDSGSTDKTVEISEKLDAQVIEFSKGLYSDWRNEGAKVARGEWLLYVDADERVTPQLRKEIVKIIKQSKFSVFAIPRKNVILGKEMRHGGWWPDYVLRLIRKEDLIKWVGDLHENPKYKGRLAHLKNPLTHIKHDNLFDMVEKTNKWSEIEAEMLFKSDHPKMTWWRFFRVMLTELWLRLIKLKGILDGVKGVIYAIYQMWSKFVTYAKLWEMQLNKKN